MRLRKLLIALLAFAFLSSIALHYRSRTISESTVTCANIVQRVSVHSAGAHRGHEKAVQRAHLMTDRGRSVEVVVKRANADMLQRQTHAEVIRRFRNERDFSERHNAAMRRRGFESAFVQQYGGCLEDAPLATDVALVVEQCTPLRDFGDDDMARAPLRFLQVILQLAKLLDYLDRARVVFCDLHPGQFGLCAHDRLKVLDVDSLRELGEPSRRLFSEVTCSRHEQCRRHLQHKHCATAVRMADIEDVKCDQDTGQCHGVDTRLNVYSARAIVKIVRDAFDPTRFVSFFYKASRDGISPPQTHSTTYSTNETRAIADMLHERVLQPMLRPVQGERVGARDLVGAVRHVIQEVCDQQLVDCETELLRVEKLL